MDSYQIDMELLRRLGDVRNAIQGLDEDVESGRTAIQDAVASVRAQAGDESSGLAELLDTFHSGIDELDSDELTPTSRFSTGAMSVCEALEEYLISLDAPNAPQLLEQAEFTLLLSLGRGPQSGSSSTAGETSEETTAEPAPGREAVPRTDPGELNDMAGYLVRMDPRKKDHARKLFEMNRAILEQGGLPTEVEGILTEAHELLEKVTAPPRVRKATREEAVIKVGDLVEEALVKWEIFLEGSPAEDPSPSASGQDEEEVEDVELELEDRTPEEEEEEEETAHPEPAGQEDSRPEPEAEAAAEAEDEGEGNDGLPEEEPLPETADPDLLADFITEGLEYLASAEEALLDLEADPSDEESVNVVFRAFHTIKGVSGFLELTRVSDLAHHAETLLSRVRDGDLRFTGSVADLSLRSADLLKELLSNIQNAMDGGPIRIPASYGSLLAVLTDPKLFDQLSSGEGSLELAAPEEGDEDEEAVNDQPGSKVKRAKTAEASVRVRTDRLDDLVDMVGELVIAHSMLAQDQVILRDGANLAKKVDHAAKILRELQDLSTGLRMVPLKPAFRKVARVVRDLSRKSGKLVHFVTEGEETEIDRTMVDVIADPLVHMVRNSIDHGLESPQEREEAGKARQGTVRVSAYQAGGNVVVEITDDGRGLDREKILAKAIERGIVESDRGLSDSDIFNLIFAPGFSTAEAVTEISGRGVGMDVVRRSVESLRGRVAIASEAGKGSTFQIHLPLTLAITDGMLIQVGKECYIIPTVKIHKSFRPDEGSLSTVANRGEMVLLHDDLIPVVRLHRIFGIPEAVEDPKRGLLVIIGEGSRRCALLVDELVTQHQFVIKALSGIVADTVGIAGGAILGNGDVGLILDTEELISLARGEARSAA